MRHSRHGEEYEDDLPAPWVEMMKDAREEKILAAFQAHPDWCFTVDTTGNTPVHWAVRNQHERFFDYLLSQRVRLDIISHNYVSPLEEAILHVNQDWGCKAAKTLVEHGAPIRGEPKFSLTEPSSDPLSTAFGMARLDILEVFQESGDSLLVPTPRGDQLPVSYACLEKYPELLAQLHEKNLVAIEPLQSLLLSMRRTYAAYTWSIPQLRHIDQLRQELETLHRARILEGNTPTPSYQRAQRI